MLNIWRKSLEGMEFFKLLVRGLTLYYRQANQQAREVSPRISMATLEEVEAEPTSRRMIIVRHPFSR